MSGKFIIVDWANNHLFQDKDFETFLDGWDFLYERFDKELAWNAAFLEDYFVIEADSLQGKLARGIDPRTTD